ncbi:MAG: sporulation protein YunB [Syntrophomonadales bacterium]
MYGRRSRFKVFLIIALPLIIAFYLIIDSNLENTLNEIAKSKAQLTGQQIITQAVNEKVAWKTEYQDLVVIHKDGEGRVVLIQPNTVKINRLMAETLLYVEKGFAELETQSYSIPLGQALGSRVFAGYGPGIKVRMVPVGRVNADLVDHFEEAGINQTRHLVCLKVSGKIKVVVPFNKEEIDVAMTIPVAETIVVGQVPNTYMMLKNQGKIVGLSAE